MYLKILIIILSIWSTNSFAFWNLGVKTNKSKVYTLYRNNPFDVKLRVHVATFDVDENEEYNQVNCKMAADLRMGQPDTVAKYWCEKGYFRE